MEIVEDPGPVVTGLAGWQEDETVGLERTSPSADIHQQAFALRYGYPVYFTRDCFDPANPCVRHTLTRLEGKKAPPRGRVHG